MLLRVRFRQGETEVDQIVADDSESHPALHPRVAFVAAAVESVAALEQADASLGAGPPFLPLLEPALLLFTLPLRALRGAVGHRHPCDAHGLRRGLRLRRVEAGVG